MGDGTRLDDLLQEAAELFARAFGSPPAHIASAPGRINLIGEHTDYNRGLALPGAIDRWVVVALSPTDLGRVEVFSESYGERCELSLAAETEDSTPDRSSVPAELPGWARLPLGVGRLFSEACGTTGGFRATISGNLPRGAGLSSSAAVEVALLNTLRSAYGADLDDSGLIRMAQRVEHEYLGVETGLMDPYTSQLARPHTFMLVDFDAIAHEYVEVGLEDWTWVLLDSGVRHELADSAYGERVRETREGLKRISQADPAIRSFRDLTPGHLQLVEDPVLRSRLRHYLEENGRVRRAAEAVAAGDARALGDLLFASHASLRDDYAVSCAELDVLVDTARGEDGCAGARMMGGGFGGCTLNLLREEAAVDLVAAVTAEFTHRFGYAPGVGVYRLVGGARVHGH